MLDKKCLANAGLFIMCIVTILLVSELANSKKTVGVVTDKFEVSKGFYIVKVRTLGGDEEILSLKNDLITLKLGSDQAYKSIKIGAVQTFYSLGSDDNISIVE